MVGGLGGGWVDGELGGWVRVLGADGNILSASVSSMVWAVPVPPSK